MKKIYTRKLEIINYDGVPLIINIKKHYTIGNLKQIISNIIQKSLKDFIIIDKSTNIKSKSKKYVD